MSAVVDRSWVDHRGTGAAPNPPDLVRLANPSPVQIRQMRLEGAAMLRAIGRRLAPREADAEFVGMVMLAPQATKTLLALRGRLADWPAGRSFHEAPSPAKTALTDLLAELIAGGEEVAAIEIYKGWMEVDSFEDYRRMWTRTAS